MKRYPHPSVFSSLMIILAIALVVGVIYLVGHFYYAGRSAESAVTSAEHLTGYGTARPLPDIMSDFTKAEAALAVEQTKLASLQATFGSQSYYSPQTIFVSQSRIDTAIQKVPAGPNQAAIVAKLQDVNRDRARTNEALNAWNALAGVPPAEQNAAAIKKAAQAYATVATEYLKTLDTYIASLPPGTPPQVVADLKNEVAVLTNVVNTINTNQNPATPSGNPAADQQLLDQQNLVNQLQNQVNNLNNELNQAQQPPGYNPQNPPPNPDNPLNPDDSSNPAPPPPCFDIKGAPCLIQGSNSQY